MITFLTLITTLFTQFPMSQEMASDLSSNLASYDGETLCLEGDVSLEHELGHMEAQKALIKKTGALDNPNFSQINLQTDVSLHFQNHGELFCAYAHLDFQNLKGTFTSGDYPVLYRTLFKGNTVTLELFGREIDITLKKTGDHCEIATLLTKDSVHIDYGADFHLDSERALYLKEGVLKAYSDTPQEWCHLTHLEDYIDADQITMDLNTEQLVIHSPKGEITSFLFPNMPDRKCHISSNQLTWDTMSDTLTLRGNIILKNGYIGEVQGEKKVCLTRKTLFGKKVIQTMEAHGKTILTSHDGQKLTSFGSLKLDRNTLELTCESPFVEGKVPPKKQLIYEKDSLTLFADTAALKYSIKGVQLKPHSIHLNGHVRIISHEERQPFRCGIADHVQYSPNTGEILLLSNSEKHVLFWHEKQNLKMSASEIIITIDPETKEEHVKGIGAVRLAFNQEEDKLLEKLFPYYR